MEPCRWGPAGGRCGPAPGASVDQCQANTTLPPPPPHPQVSSSARFQIQLSGGGQRWPLLPQRPLPLPHTGAGGQPLLAPAPPGSSPWALDQNLECQRWPGPLGTPPWPCCGAARVTKAWRRDPRSAAGGMSRPVHPWEPSVQVEVKAQLPAWWALPSCPPRPSEPSTGERALLDRPSPCPGAQTHAAPGIGLHCNSPPPTEVRGSPRPSPCLLQAGVSCLHVSAPHQGCLPLWPPELLFLTQKSGA